MMKKRNTLAIIMRCYEELVSYVLFVLCYFVITYNTTKQLTFIFYSFEQKEKGKGDIILEYLRGTSLFCFWKGWDAPLRFDLRWTMDSTSR